MGLFDEVMSKVAGGAGAAAGLSALGIDPKHAGLAQAAMGLLTDEKAGGLGGLQQKFQQAGLGEAMDSWISTGENKPVSAQQLEGALGSGLIQQLAQKAGLNASQVAPLLTTILPLLVNKLTPQGQVPSGGSLLEAGLALLGGKK